MEIPQEFVDAMIAHAVEETPNECCGLLAMKDGKVVEHYRMKNTEKSPYRYSMDGKELLQRYREIEDAGWEIGVIYHSHTHSPAYPSDTDVRLATWPDAYYCLVSPHEFDSKGQVLNEAPVTRVFTIKDGEITEVPLSITA